MSKSYFYKQPKMKARIYQEQDESESALGQRFGILAAVEDDQGMCYVGFLPANKRVLKKITVKDYGGLARLKSENWEDVQTALDEYAEERGLKELPI